MTNCAQPSLQLKEMAFDQYLQFFLVDVLVCTIIMNIRKGFLHQGQFESTYIIETLVYVVVQFYPWFKFYFLLFWGMVIYDNEFKTKGNKI